DRLRRELHGQDLLLAVHAGRDHAAPGRAFDLECLEVILHLRLHALQVLHHLADVHQASSTGAGPSPSSLRPPGSSMRRMSTIWAPNVSSRLRTPASRRASSTSAWLSAGGR